MSLVSVVIACHNYGSYLDECIQSIKEQIYDSIEIIIVISGSTDDTVYIAKRLMQRYKNVKFINAENTGGPAIPRNIGIENSIGEYIMCLDPDDRISNNYISESVRLLELDGKYSICFSNLKHFGDLESYIKNKDYDNRLILRINYIPVASLFRKICWLEVGGYRTNLPGYEDWDFWINSYSKGHFHRYSKESVFYYRKHNKSMLLECSKNDLVHKANIVINNSQVFSKLQIDWAKAVVGKNADEVIAFNPGLGLIPLTEELILHNKQNIHMQKMQFLNKLEENVKKMC